MEKYLILIVLQFFFLFAIYAQAESEIVGFWKHTKTEVANLDEVANSIFNAQLNFYKEIKKSLETTLKNKNISDSEKKDCQNSINHYNKQIKELNIDSIKNIIINSKIGDLKFYSNNTFVVYQLSDSINGTWSICKNEIIDTLNLIVYKTSRLQLLIKSVSSNEM